MIRDEKKRRLAWCQERLRGLQSAASAGQLDAPVLRELADVLTLRARLEAAREWPCDVSVVARLAFYLVIPLVSWAGAAVVERAVNAFLG